jgi:uncharacterized protein
LLALIALLLGTFPLPSSPGGDSLSAASDRERHETELWLQSSPTSYLATIQRKDFGDQTSLTVGRAEDNDVRIDDSTVAAHHLQVTVTGDSFHIATIEPGAFFIANKETLQTAMLSPGGIMVGRFTLRLSHQRFPALIVFDPQSPRFKEYKGLKYFAYDPAFRFILPLTVNTANDTVVILSTRGNQRHGLRTGWFDFSVGGKHCRLEVTRLLEPGVGEKSYSIFFHDLTCGRESYPMGRYVEAQELPDGLFLLDFNNAYNPACAFSEHYNCPIPPDANHLNVRIRAGEKDAGYMEH